MLASILQQSWTYLYEYTGKGARYLKKIPQSFVPKFRPVTFQVGNSIESATMVAQRNTWKGPVTFNTTTQVSRRLWYCGEG